MRNVKIKTPAQLNKMRQAGRIVAKVLELLRQYAVPGVTTKELDSIAEKEIKRLGGKPAFKNYRGFPSSICASINCQVVHGIPSNVELLDGDLLSLDVGVFWKGFAGDAAVTFTVGDISKDAQALTAATYESLDAAINVIKPDVRVSDISEAIENVARKAGYDLVTQYTGHGIGSSMHEPPQIPNVVSTRFLNRSPRLPEGSVIAIEPMLTVGNAAVEVMDDGWTVVTADRKLSAHAEHTVAVGAHGPLIMTVV